MKKSAVSLRFYTSLLFPLFVALALVAVQRNRTEKAACPADPSPMLQFTSGGHVVGFEGAGVYVAGGSHVLHVEFVNPRLTNPASRGMTGNPRNATPLSKVDYSNLWDGVTLSYDAPDGAIARSTYRIEPQADVDNIRLRYNAPVSVQRNGELRIAFNSGAMNESAPQAWQERDGKRVPIEIAFARRGEREVGFVVGNYNRSEPLFIDPTLTWNTFLGGTGSDVAFHLATDVIGNVYVAGFSTADWGSPVQAYGGGVEAYAAKLDSSGNILWTTFLGGTGNDEAFGVAVDVIGNVYVTGYSDATWGSPVNPFSGGIFDTFTSKLDSNGNLIWNTFFGSGGLGSVLSRGVAVDAIGNVCVTGFSTASFGSPVRAFGGGAFDGYVVKLDSNGVFIWNTFLGGSATDNGNAIGIDGIGNIYIGGYSEATWGSPIRAFAGLSDGFVAKLDLAGNLLWNTFLGGSGGAQVNGVAVDVVGNVYACGSSSATWGTPVALFNSSTDAFAAKLDSSGTLIWNTFVGGNSSEIAQAVAIDLIGNVYLAGSSDTTWGSPDRPFSGGSFDAYAAQIDPAGNLVWNTFLGGSGTDFGFGVGVDGIGNVYVAGYTNGSTWGSPIRAYTAAEDGFVAKLIPGASPTPTPTPTATPTPTPTPAPTPTPTATPTPTPTPTPSPTPVCQFPSSITANFNGTAIHSGSYVWFNSVMKPSGLGSTPVTFRFTQQTITSSDFTLAVPDSMVTFDPSATSATTDFIGGMWVTRVPSFGLAGNTFFSAVSFQVPTNIPGGVKTVKWSGVIIPDTPGASLQWKWAGAVYSMFISDYNLLGVKPVDDNHASFYQNSDHAGTPENFKMFVMGGATGGGGSNYTGGYSGTDTEGPCP